MTDDPEITDPRDPMKRRDIVAELDHWLGGSVQAEPHLILKRARDEIVALRAERDKPTWDPDRDEIVRLRVALERHDRLVSNAVAVRDEALEAAARVCEGGYTTGSTASTLKAVAKAIRALKDKGG